jgi:probable phosphoglycerate mutase
MRVVYLARHGETDWNVAGRWQGHTDVPLNDAGRTQARELAETLRVHGLGAVVASDLSRAHETARIVAVALGIEVAFIDERLRERCFGVFEGLTRDECQAQHAEAWRAWTERRITPGGAESQEVLAARVLAALGRVAAEVAREDAPALAVTHGGALRAVVAAATGTMPPFVKNGEVWRLVWDERIVEARPLGG